MFASHVIQCLIPLIAFFITVFFVSICAYCIFLERVSGVIVVLLAFYICTTTFDSCNVSTFCYERDYDTVQAFLELSL